MPFARTCVEARYLYTRPRHPGKIRLDEIASRRPESSIVNWLSGPVKSKQNDCAQVDLQA